MTGSFRKRLLAGELLIGPMITLPSAATAELLSTIGFDWFFVDAEHSAMSAADFQGVMRAAGSQTPCLVRVAERSEMAIKKALDSGAAGIIVPGVNTAEQAAAVVQHARYAPLGTRGVGLARAHGYGMSFQEYMEAANDRVTVVVQAEHKTAVANIEQIVNITGVDAVLIGPYDLSASMGHMGEVDHPQVKEALNHVRAVCRESQMPLGIFGVSATAVQPYIEQGYTLIVAGVDTLLLGQAAQRLLNQLR